MFTNQLLLFGLGAQEILLIALIVLLLFGGKKIPELMKGLGRSVKSFKEGVNEVDDAVNDTAKDVKESAKETPVMTEQEPKKDE